MDKVTKSLLDDEAWMANALNSEAIDPYCWYCPFVIARHLARGSTIKVVQRRNCPKDGWNCNESCTR